MTKAEKEQALVARDRARRVKGWAFRGLSSEDKAAIRSYLETGNEADLPKSYQLWSPAVVTAETCPRCDGGGEEHSQDPCPVGVDPQEFDRSWPCPECDGTGRVSL